jgi:hypothetical protein
MNGEEESGAPGGTPCLHRPTTARTRKSHGKQAKRDPVKDNGIGGMNQEAGQMISERVDAPQKIIQRECQPTEWLILTEVEGCKHPLKLSPAKAAIVPNCNQRALKLNEAVR